MLPQILYYSKVVAGVGAAAGVIYAIWRKLRNPFKEIKEASAAVNLLATNHIPHIQTALDEHGKALVELKTNSRVIKQELQDTKEGVHTLGEAFLRHLENASEPKGKKRASKK